MIEENLELLTTESRNKDSMQIDTAKARRYITNHE